MVEEHDRGCGATQFPWSYVRIIEPNSSCAVIYRFEVGQSFFYYEADFEMKFPIS